MKQVPDRKRMRREYLRKKQSKYVDAALSIAIMMAALIPFLVFLWFSGSRTPESRWSCSFFAITLLVVVASVVMTRVRQAQTEVRRLPYVPPVTPDTLPAEEILIRGSEESPSPQSAVLLRAARKGEETAKEELLRVNQE